VSPHPVRRSAPRRMIMESQPTLGESSRHAQHHTSKEDRAARLIQRTYRGHADRTRVRGMKLYVNRRSPT